MIPVTIHINSSIHCRHLHGVHEPISVSTVLGKLEPRLDDSWHPYDLPADYEDCVSYFVNENPRAIECALVVSIAGEIEDDLSGDDATSAFWSPKRFMGWFNYVTTHLPRTTSAFLDVSYRVHDTGETFQVSFWLDSNTQQILFFTENQHIRKNLCDSF